jgi:opacity protein-like surface antigen
MKRIFASLILATGLISGVFSADFKVSAGGGGLAGYTFTRYTLQLEDNKGVQVQSMDRFDYGGYLFFDATYAEAAVSIQGGNSSWTESMKTTEVVFADNKGTGAETNLGISLNGKYPLTVSEHITWFPLLGVEYRIALMQKRLHEGSGNYNRTSGVTPEDRDKNGETYPLSAWNSFWIQVGAGLDYSFTESLFVRSELLFGVRLPTGYENGAFEMTKETFGSTTPKMGGLTGEPQVRVALGYRFM